MLRKALQLMVAAVVASAVLAAPASAARICLPVRATGAGQDLGNFMTTATIRSHGLLLGTS